MRAYVLVASAAVILCILALAGADSSSGDGVYDYDAGSKTLYIHEDVPDFQDPDVRPWRADLDDAEVLVIEEGVTSIGSRAFADSSSIQRLSLPSSLVSVGERAFADCTALIGVTLPANVDRIGGGAFSGCSRLAEVRVECSPSSAGTGIFDGSSSSVDGFDLVYASASVPDGMFSPSPGRSVIIKTADLSAVRTVGAGAFRNVSLENLSLPLAAESVGEYAFAGSSVTSVRIPGPTALGTGAFFGCTSLVTASIPAVNAIPESAFRSCTSLESVSLSVRLVSVSDHAFSGTGLRELVFPGTLRSVGTEAFSYCPSLAHVAFTDSAYRIGDRAFSHCPSLSVIELQDVSLPGADVFDGCGSVERAVCMSGSFRLPASARVYTGFSDGPDVLVRYDFGSVGGGCILFSDTVMSPSLIDGGQGRSFEGWRDGDGNIVTDTSGLSSSTELTASWAGDEGGKGAGTAEIVLCILAVSCVVIMAATALRRV